MYRRAISFLVYHFERRKSAPGRKAASIKPRKKRVRSAPTKLCVIPVKTLRIRNAVSVLCLHSASCRWTYLIAPQINIAPAIYQLGRVILAMIMFDGTCIRI